VFFTGAYLGQFSGLISVVFALLLLGLVVLQVYRYRLASSYRERQQTKWVVFGLVVALGGFALFLIVGNLFVPADLQHSPVANALVPTTVTQGLLLFVPISIAIAILRSRLYDIDRIINKALVYGLLTGIIGALYGSIIIGLVSLTGAITGQASPNPLVLVIATLVIVVLVQPLRKRVQNTVDRRFYRRKYDAEKTLSALSASLRDEVDLEQLCEHVLAVVRETTQPAYVSLWLRVPERHGTDTATSREP
jgi:MFS family permease